MSDPADETVTITLSPSEWDAIVYCARRGLDRISERDSIVPVADRAIDRITAEVASDRRNRTDAYWNS